MKLGFEVGEGVTGFAFILRQRKGRREGEKGTAEREGLRIQVVRWELLKGSPGCWVMWACLPW